MQQIKQAIKRVTPEKLWIRLFNIRRFARQIKKQFRTAVLITKSLSCPSLGFRSQGGMKRTDISDTTILIKTFDRSRNLRRLLKSIFFYYPDVKVVVADDSADPEKTNREVMGRWPGKDIEYLALPYDVGLSEGRNRALARVKTPYFVLCDDDFVFDRRTNLELMKRQLEEHKVDLVAGMYFESSHYQGISRLYTMRENILGLLYDIGFRFLLPHRGSLVARFEYDPGSKKLTAVKLDVDKGELIEADMAPNFFLAKTSIRSKVMWRPELKLGEHLVFFWDFKEKGFKLLVNTELGVNHIRSMSLGYKMKRFNEKFYEYKMLGMKYMNLEILEAGETRMTYRNGHFTKEKIAGAVAPIQRVKEGGMKQN